MTPKDYQKALALATELASYPRGKTIPALSGLDMENLSLALLHAESLLKEAETYVERLQDELGKEFLSDDSAARLKKRREGGE